LVVVAGCEEGDEAFVRDFLIDWALDNPASTMGGFFGVGEGNEVTAAVGALETIDNVNKADALMDEGRDKRDTAKMDEAIKLRPRDWTYRTSRAVLALDQGNASGYDADVQAAQELSPDRLVGGRTVSGSEREVRQRYNELADVEVRLGLELDAGRVVNGERCNKIYQEMAIMADRLQQAARTAGDQDAFDNYGDLRRIHLERQGQCPS
jgi:hypothetical protein